MFLKRFFLVSMSPYRFYCKVRVHFQHSLSICIRSRAALLFPSGLLSFEIFFGRFFFHRVPFLILFVWIFGCIFFLDPFYLSTICPSLLVLHQRTNIFEVGWREISTSICFVVDDYLFCLLSISLGFFIDHFDLRDFSYTRVDWGFVISWRIHMLKIIFEFRKLALKLN